MLNTLLTVRDQCQAEHLHLSSFESIIISLELYSYLRSPYRDLVVYDSVVQVRYYLQYPVMDSI